MAVNAAVPPVLLLRVAFTGVCTFVVAKDSTLMTVLLPQAKYDEQRANGRGMRHHDLTPAVAHAAFVRFDLAHLATGGHREWATPGVTLVPANVIRRLDGEEFSFALAWDGNPMTGSLDLPDFDMFAPVLELKRELLDPAPGDAIAARGSFRGGKIAKPTDGRAFELSRVLSAAHVPGAKQAGVFLHPVVWECPVKASSIVLTLSRFDNSSIESFELTPVIDAKGVPVVNVMIGNLCACDLVGWPELESPRDPSDDVDFKWHENLFRAKPHEADPTFDAVSQVPYLIPSGQHTRGIIHDCYGARAAFPT